MARDCVFRNRDLGQQGVSRVDVSRVARLEALAPHRM